MRDDSELPNEMIQEAWARTIDLDPNVRCQAVIDLMKLSAPLAHLRFVHLIADPEKSVRNSVAYQLNETDIVKAGVIPLLLYYFSARNYDIRIDSLCALQNIRHRQLQPALACRVIATIGSLSVDDDHRIVFPAVCFISHFLSANQKAIEDDTTALEWVFQAKPLHVSPLLEYSMYYRLSRLEKRNVEDELRASLASMSLNIRITALIAIISIWKICSHLIILAFADPHPLVRAFALRFCNYHRYTSCFGQICDLLGDPDSNVRYSATLAYVDLAGVSPRVSRTLGTMLKDPDPIVRYASCLALIKCKVMSQDVIPLILAALEDTNDEVRDHAQRLVMCLEEGVIPIVENE